jgi:DNA-binding transcriptional ArsR family regulator
MSETINEKTYSKYFKAFSDPTRLRILKLLAAKEMSVSEIVRKVGLSQPTVSRHLSILREAEVVDSRRDGQLIFYSLNRKSVASCCAGFCDCLVIPVPRAKKSKKS